MNHAIYAVIAVAAFGAGGCAGGLGLFSDVQPERTSTRAFAFADQCVGCGTVESIDLVRFGEGRRGGAAVATIVDGDFERPRANGVIGVADVVVDAVNGRLQPRPENVDVFEIFVRMDDGRHYVIEQFELQGIRKGSRVLVQHGNASLL